ncbi:snaclec mucetin subunit beta-like [Asterias amurensis]|uniref:snaclec mucetin subunit beta-like n=1 Tax=Asterias amurensis TaxID=7602 RepID=UPI003AB5011F
MNIGVLLFLVGCYATLAAICPTDWQRYGESCYLLITQKLDWQDARDICIELHADLAFPNSDAEQKFIWEMYGGFYPAFPGGLWIVCNDFEETGNWQPCPLSDNNGYQHWATGFPQNTNNHCVAMSSSIGFFGGQWANRNCNGIYKKYATCEYHVNTTTPLVCLQTGPDGRVESQCLVGHVMTELRADGVMSCGKACRSEPRCRSFNLLMEQGPGKMVCQLNNATRHEAADGNMKARDKCYFFEL